MDTEKQSAAPQQVPLLVTGHPRCGTTYAAVLCQQLGLPVGHEKLEAGGISSWMFAVDAPNNPYAHNVGARSRSAIRWQFLVMPVRDIATAAPSVIRENERAPPSYDFRRTFIRSMLGIDLDNYAPLEKAVYSITAWTRMILLQSPDCIFRIEDQHELFRAFLLDNGLIPPACASIMLDTSAVNANKPYKGVKYPKPDVSESDWDQLSAEAKREINWYCNEFGYASPLAR